MDIRDKSSSWQDFLRSNAADDLLMVAHNHRLNYNGQPIHLHWLDRVSLLLIRQAYSQQQSFALCYPVPTCNLPVLAAAQLFIHDLVQNRSNTLSVLLISSRTEVREHYLNLNVSSEPIASALPIARIRTDGNPEIIRVSGQNTVKIPKLYHVSRSQLLDTSLPQEIGAIIVDHVNGSFDNEIESIQKLAAQLDMPVVIHLCANPFAPFFNKLNDTPIWVWNHHGLAVDFNVQMTSRIAGARHPFSISNRQFSNIAAGIRHRYLVSRHPVMEGAAHRLWEDLGTVQESFNENPSIGIQRAIRASYGIFYTMLHMLVPLPIYEEEARHQWGIRPIRKRIDDLKSLTTLFSEKVPNFEEIYWSSMVMDFEEMYKALMARNPKCDTLLQEVHAHLKHDNRLVIVCPNQATRRMLQLYLQTRKDINIKELLQQDEHCQIRLITYKDLGTLTHCDTLLFPGQFSYGRRHLMLSAAAPEIHYLVYGEEAARIEQQTKAVHRTLTETHRNEEKKHIWYRLRGMTSVPLDDRSEPNINMMRETAKSVSRQTVAAARNPDLSIWTPFSTPEYEFIQETDIHSIENEVLLCPPESKNISQDVTVPTLRIEFVDGFCYAEPNSQMNVYLPATGKTDNRTVDKLRLEDIVIFVNGDQRTRLYEAILQCLEHHGKMGTTYMLVRYWQNAVRERFSRSGLTYSEFLTRLQKLGSQMKSVPGIRCWIEGLVLGPNKAEDIQRAGKVLADKGLIQEWKRIHQALRRIRGLHISLARKLNRVIVQAGLKGHQPVPNECIDAELNLYLDDFRDSVRLQRIVHISDKTISVPYLFTGEFLTKEQELKW